MSEESRRKRAEQIRARLENPGEVDIIPPNLFFEDQRKNKKELVGVYCRVSTKQESQAESLEVQKQHIEDLLEQHPNWELVKIYPDEGISATSMKNRKHFLEMIEDCKAGKLTLIVTKEVSRFARNTIDCVATCRMLKGLPNPVGVFFETVNLNTLYESSELLLTILSIVAQEESANKSSSIKWAIRTRFDKGIPRIVKAYGFDVCKDEDSGKRYLVPNADAWVVKVLYDMALDGQTMGKMLGFLKESGIPSPLYRQEWNRTTLWYILTNERYCGDVLSQKTLRVNLFTHKSIKNMGQLTQYYSEQYHEGIIPRAKWLAVQRILGTANPFGKSITEGELAGYMPVLAEPGLMKERVEEDDVQL